MSTASDKPAGADSAREYKAHFELWDEVSPAFEQKAALPAIVHFQSVSPRRRFRPLALALMALPAVILAIIFWMTTRVAQTPTNLAVSKPPSIEAAAPSAAPAAPTPLAEAAVAPPHPMVPPPAPQRVESPPTPAAMASMAAAVTASVPPPEPSEGAEEEAVELSPEKREMLEGSIRSELTHLGFPKVGVSVAKDGDVFLSGTLLDRADETRVIATVRNYDDARDIYFSGALWHESDAQPQVVTMPTPAPEQLPRSTAARETSN